MPETSITTKIKNKMDTFESVILGVAKECYEELSETNEDMYLIQKWSSVMERSNGDVWLLLSKLSQYQEEELITKYALAGFWYYRQTPEGAEKEATKDE